MIAIVQVIMIFLVPFLILKYSNFVITKWIGSIGSAYLFGILVALIIYFINLGGITFQLNTDVGEIGSFVTISIAIPLLLFGANLKEAKKLSKVVFKSFASLVISALVVTAIVFYIYAHTLPHGAELSGMAIGLYTGGTPNLNAIGNFYVLDAEVIATANLSDMIFGAVFYIFLLLLAKPLLSKFLPKNDNEVYVKEELVIENTDELHLKEFKITKRLLKVVLISFVMTVAGAGIGMAVWAFSDGAKMTDMLVPSLMISVTVLGIIGSFNKWIRETKGMNVIGQYFILIFSFALASSLDFNQLQGQFLNTLVLYGSITIGVFILHVIISKFLKVDADCTIVTLTAGVYGPAFVPAITKQIKNDDLTAPGLITGSIGYAIGTFLGILLAYIFMI
jgi:uncharacterized membrane protein